MGPLKYTAVPYPEVTPAEPPPATVVTNALVDWQLADPAKSALEQEREPLDPVEYVPCGAATHTPLDPYAPAWHTTGAIVGICVGMEEGVGVGARVGETVGSEHPVEPNTELVREHDEHAEAAPVE